MNLPKPKELLKNVALATASLAFCFTLVEVALRVMGYGNVEIYEPDRQLFWQLKPSQNCYTKIDRKPVHINSHGTRGPEFNSAKPPGTLRILSLGDSRTFGWGLSEAETYSGRLEKLLQDRLGPARKAEVINAGVNAWSFPQMLVYFRERALAFQPDLVILGDANYWTQFSEQSSPEFVTQFMRRVWLKNLLRRFALYHFVVEVQLKDFYERHRLKFIPVDPKQDTLFKEQQQADPDAVFRQSIENFCQLAVSKGVQPVLLYQPTLTELETGEVSSIGRVKRDLHQRNKVPLVDLTSALAPQGKALYLEADPVHLNAAGNEIIAQKLFESVLPLIKP
jgi:lysophospholipase L1-like esterase